MKKTILLPTLVISTIFLLAAVLAGFFAIKTQLQRDVKTTLTLRIDNGERIFQEFFDTIGADSSQLTEKFVTHDNIIVTYGDKILFKSDKSFTPNFSKDNEIVEKNGCFVMSRQLNTGYFIVAYEEVGEVTELLKIFVVTSVCVVILFLILMSAVLSSVIKKKISLPLTKVISVNSELAKGNTKVELNTKNSKGEVLDLTVSAKEIISFCQNQLQIIEKLAKGEAEQIKLAARSEQDEFSKYFKIIADNGSKHAALPEQFKKGIELTVDVITEIEDYTSKIMSVGASGLFISIPENKDGKPFDSQIGEIYNISFIDSISGIFSVTVEVAEINSGNLTVRPIAKLENEQRRNYVRVPATGISAIMTAKIFDEDKKNMDEITEAVAIMDISLGGIRIKTDRILKEESALKLKLKADAFGELDLIGEVRRTFSINGSRFAGIEFFADTAAAEQLYKFIRTKELEIFSSSGHGLS
jgi:c-di-GMP-binding flagellar brake protein YcgR